jgi:hypothetical protein
VVAEPAFLLRIVDDVGGEQFDLAQVVVLAQFGPWHVTSLARTPATSPWLYEANVAPPGRFTNMPHGVRIAYREWLI